MPNYSMRIVWHEDDQVYVATCPELGNLAAHGASCDEAAASLKEAVGLAVENYKEEGWPLPAAIKGEEYSGQLRLRLPKPLHARLAQTAQVAGVSLNTMIVSLLASSSGSVEALEYATQEMVSVLNEIRFVPSSIRATLAQYSREESHDENLSHKPERLRLVTTDAEDLSVAWQS